MSKKPPKIQMPADRNPETAKAKEKPPSNAGRKSKYRPEMCDELVASMERGLSFEASCGAMRISKDTGYNYVKLHPEFALAKELGESLGQHFWENEAIENLWIPKDGGKFNATTFVFTMKNRFGWRDKKEITGSFGVGLGSIDDLYKGYTLPQIEMEITKMIRLLAYSVNFKLDDGGKPNAG